MLEGQGEETGVLLDENDFTQVLNAVSALEIAPAVEHIDWLRRDYDDHLGDAEIRRVHLNDLTEHGKLVFFVVWFKNGLDWLVEASIVTTS